MRPHCLSAFIASIYVLCVHCDVISPLFFHMPSLAVEISDGHCIQISMTRKVETSRSVSRKSSIFVSVTDDHSSSSYPISFPYDLNSWLLENIRLYINAYNRCGIKMTASLYSTGLQIVIWKINIIININIIVLILCMILLLHSTAIFAWIILLLFIIFVIYMLIYIAHNYVYTHNKLIIIIFFSLFLST